MNSIAKPLYQFITNVIFSEQQLVQYCKLNEQDLEEVFIWLDFRKRGIINVSDFYTRFPELNQRELFYIFGLLDGEKKGSLSLDGLIHNQYLRGRHGLSNGDPINTFMNFINALATIFHKIEDYKRQLNITNQYLQQVFDGIDLMKKATIDIRDVILMFKEAHLETDSKIILFLENRVFRNRSFNRRQFVCEFLLMGSNDILGEGNLKYRMGGGVLIPNLQLRNKAEQYLKEYEKLDCDIDKILLKYRGAGRSTNLQQIKQKLNFHSPQASSSKFKMMNYTKLDESYSNNKLEDYTSYLTTPSSQSKPNPKIIPHQQDPQNEIISTYKQKLQYNQHTKDINKRREQLKKGSFERQKIIDDVINKRKSIGKQSFLKQFNIQHFQHPKYQFQGNKVGKNSNKLQYQSFGYNNKCDISPSHKISKFTNFGIDEEKLQNQLLHRKQHLMRSISATKLTSPSLNSQSIGREPQYKNLQPPKWSDVYQTNFQQKIKTINEKQNILKKAQEDAMKKIEEIQKNARLKVMQKKSAACLYNGWFKEKLK